MWLRLLDMAFVLVPLAFLFFHPMITHPHIHTRTHNISLPGCAASNWRANAARVVEETAVKLKKATQRAKAAADEVDILLKEDQSSGKRPNFKIFVDEGTIPNGKAAGRWQG